ncbi:MAG: glycosyltransferase family A protein [Rhizomicrobium sp.]|jgi:glycosyltransferase involved in cell wall biosynthesis
MMTSPRFESALVTFAIPLRRPVSVADRKRLDDILSLALGSIYRQTHDDFRVLVAAAHQPVLPSFVDDRLEIVAVPGIQPRDWHDAIRDVGERRLQLARRFANLGGGYLMLVDHDDFVSCRIVEHVNKDRHPNGYAVRNGLIFDTARNVLAHYPIREITDDEFHHFCGTAFVLRLDPEDVLGTKDGEESFYLRTQSGGHHRVFERMRDAGRPLEGFPFPAAAYTRNTGENMSMRAANLEDENSRSWIVALDAAVYERRIIPDAPLREEFAMPAEYPRVANAGQPLASVSVADASLSVLICTHRRPQGLRRILSALVPQLKDRPAREVIVVNDGTHDDDYEAVVEEFAAHIRYRALKKNVGVAAARNAAARMAAGDYLIFTDDDCEPPPFWLDWIVARLDQHPELDLVAGATKPLWPRKPGFFAHVRAVHELIPSTAQTGGTIIFPTANVAIRRSVFESTGGFGFPDFQGAGEDTELATRLSLMGVRSLYDPAWFTRHEIEEGFFGLCRRYRRYGFANGRLIRLTTSPVAHDYMQTHWQSGWRTVWRWEFDERLAAARAAHDSEFVARISATLACLVKMAYWQGVKDAFTA